MWLSFVSLLFNQSIFWKISFGFLKIICIPIKGKSCTFPFPNFDIERSLKIKIIFLIFYCNNPKISPGSTWWVTIPHRYASKCGIFSENDFLINYVGFREKVTYKKSRGSRFRNRILEVTKPLTQQRVILINSFWRGSLGLSKKIFYIEICILLSWDTSSPRWSIMIIWPIITLF